MVFRCGLVFIADAGNSVCRLRFNGRETQTALWTFIARRYTIVLNKDYKYGGRSFIQIADI